MASALSPSSIAQGVRQGVGHLVRGRLSPTTPGADPGSWLVVTVHTDSDTVLATGLPRLAALKPAVEYDLRPAPADKGTEIFARVVTGAGAELDSDPAEVQQQLRTALRETKSLVEIGYVMVVDPQPAGKRSESVAGEAIDEAQASGREQGVL